MRQSTIQFQNVLAQFILTKTVSGGIMQKHLSHKEGAHLWLICLLREETATPIISSNAILLFSSIPASNPLSK